MYNVRELTALLQNISDVPAYEARLICEKKLPAHIVNQILDRRRQGEPLSKILGEKGFYKYIFKTGADVLDPRPDSETLVEGVLDAFPDKKQPLKILDIGTGSGCLLISIVSEYTAMQGIGLDKSAAALKIASENARVLAPCKDISFVRRDFMQADWTQGLGEFDIIISNPPYIKSTDIDSLEPAVRLYDPLLALDGGADGLNAYRTLAADIHNLLKPGGLVFFEIGQGQEQDVMDIMHRQGFVLSKQMRDLGGIIRVLIFGR